MATNTQRIVALEAAVKSLTGRVTALEKPPVVVPPPPVPDPPTPPVTPPPAGSVHGRDITLADHNDGTQNYAGAFVQRDNWIVSAAGVRVRALSL